jgi:hypothetical protein
MKSAEQYSIDYVIKLCLDVLEAQFEFGIIIKYDSFRIENLFVFATNRFEFLEKIPKQSTILFDKEPSTKQAGLDN